MPRTSRTPAGRRSSKTRRMMQAGRVDKGALEAAVKGDSVIEERLAQAFAELALAED